MTTRWRLRAFDEGRVRELSRLASVSPLIAQLLINRGVVDPAGVATFFETKLTGLHDPETLPGVIEAASRIVAAIGSRKKIVIYGDYDVDGVCGTSILWACLKLAGAPDVSYYIPHRVEEGYGVNAEALRRLATEQRADLIITVDCGISAVKEARLARELGVELIITDHHTIGPELPEADVLVHPRLVGSHYPFPELCGCAVAFKLAWQVCKGFGDGKKASPHLRDFLVKSIALVAMATVADVMPIRGENRILVRHGLAGLLRSPSPGLRALLSVAGCLGKRELNTGSIGFSLAPRINAAGRLERAMQAVEMLTTDDDEQATALAEALDLCNGQRQEVERRMVDEAHEMITEQGGLKGRGAIVLGREGWHPGVIGIVASRLVDTYHRPTIVVALGDEHGQGSARSILGFNLHEAISASSNGLLTSFGGHEMAAGLKVSRENFDAFAEAFETHCRSVLSPEQLEKSTWIDAEIMLGDLTLKVLESIEALEPHGTGNPKPVLVANRVRVVGESKIVGPKQNHLQVRFCQGETTLKAIAWNMAERGKVLTPGRWCSIAFTPSINEWNGRREVQLELRDFQLEEEGVHAQSA
jgi:single-stranded-DNA-specific exonuclease